MGQQAQEVMPHVAMKGCEIIEKSSFVHELGKQGRAAADMANSMSSKVSGENIVPKLHASKLVHDMVCVPLKRAMLRKLRSAQRDASAAFTRDSARRLLTLEPQEFPSVSSEVQKWWYDY